jgi:linoleoyl-CoA desaturase
MQTVRFIAKDENEKQFAAALKQNVRNYFKEKGISTYGDYRMWVKTVLLLGLYLTPLILVLTVEMPGWFAIILMVIMGIGEAGIGMGIMHDAVHGSYSRRPWVNNLMGRTIFLLGTNTVNWRVQHNLLHHTYTNIYKWDQDIDTKAIIRMSVHAPLKKIHRYQFIYSFFLYGLMTLSKLVTDIAELGRYRRIEALKVFGVNYPLEVFVLVMTKIIYVSVFIGLPIIFTDFAWWQILLGFVVMHSVASAIMSTVFQMAHVVMEVDQPLPDESGVIHHDKYVHQLQTTSNFGRSPWIIRWYIGGLDHQVEHHLFTNICHIHYPEIAPIVKKTAEEYGIPYHSHRSFFTALTSHVRMMKFLGRDQSSSFTGKARGAILTT